MRVILEYLSRLFDLLFAPLAGFPRIYGLLAVCVPTGAVLIAIYAWVSDQEAMRQVKQRIRLHFMEVSIYRDDLLVGVQALKGIFGQNLRYMLLTLKPATFMIVLVILLLGQLNLRFSHEPLQPGQRFVLAVKLSPETVAAAGRPKFALSVPAGLEVETPPLYMPDIREVDWRLRVKEYGDYTLGVSVNGQKAQKRVLVSRRLVSFYPELGRDSLLNIFTNPLEKPLPNDSPVESIRLHLEPAYYLEDVLGFRVHWLVAFFVFTVVVGLTIKKIFGIS